MISLLRHPFTALLARPTECGKMMDSPPRRVVYCYEEYQQLFSKYPMVTFHQGLPNLDDFDGREPTLLAVDDLMNETDDSVANLFTKRSHHRNVIVVFLVQNLFYKNKHIRTISLNAHYLVLFKYQRDASQFASLACQMYAKKSAFAVEAYRDATREPCSYLSVELRTEQNEDLRLRTNIFPNETVYFNVPK